MTRPALINTLRALLVTSVIALGMGLGANSVAADSAVVTTTPIAASFTNTCTGEIVMYTATQHTKVHVVATDQHDQGAVEVNYQDGKGVTVTGATYISKFNAVSVFNSGVDSATTSIIRVTEHLTRLKEDPLAVLPAQTGDDLVVTITEKLTVNANGSVTADRPFDVVVECR